MLKVKYNNSSDIVEIGVDEVGRGPMFGRVYCAAVILPQENFKHELMKDSKKFTSRKKLEETAKYIKDNCISYSVAYQEHDTIDKQNIKNATHMAMHKAIKELNKDNDKIHMILVDGRDFKPFTYYDKKNEIIKDIPSVCIEGGDNKYTSIAAASILAKVERDNYIYEICEKYPKLNEYYDLAKNKGYGTAKHIQGIKLYGITEWHRKSFGICKEASLISIA